MILAVAVTQVAIPVLGASYIPGVQAGNYVKLGSITSSWTSNPFPIPAPQPFSDLMVTTGIRTEVHSVSGTSVTARQTWTFTNATGTRTLTLTGDVKTGEGNLSYWIIAGGLAPGDRIADNASAPVLNYTRNNLYLGVVRSVVVLNVTQRTDNNNGLAKLALTWDQQTGVLVEFFFQFLYSIPGYSVSGLAHGVVVETNLWGGPSVPDFSLQGLPPQVTVIVGTSLTIWIFPQSLNGYDGNINLIASVSPPGPSLFLSPSSVGVHPNGSTNATLTISTTNNTPAGGYALNVTATDGSISHSTIVQLNVSPPPSGQDFTLTAEPTFLSIRQGTFGQSRLTLTSLFGLEGNISLSATIVVEYSGLAATHVTASFTKTTVTLSSFPLTNTSTVIVTAAVDAAVGRYLMNVTASGGVMHSVVIVLDVVPESFPRYMPGVKAFDWASYNIQTFWSSQIIPEPPLIIPYDHVVSANLTVVDVYGSIVLASLGQTFDNMTGFSLTISGDVNSGDGTLGLWIIANGLKAGNTIYNSSYAPRINDTITRTYAGAERVVNVYNFTISLEGITSHLVFSWDQETGVLVEEFYDLMVPGFAEGSLDIKLFQTNMWVPVPPDFGFSVEPDQLTIVQGLLASSTLSLSSLYGFEGTVQLSTLSSSTGLTTSLPGQVSLSKGQSSQATLTVSVLASLQPGSYTVGVRGTSGALSHTATVHVTVVARPDFSLNASSSSLGIEVGRSSSTTVTIMAQNGFTGLITLTVETPPGITVTLDRSSVQNAGTVTVAVAAAGSVAPGTYTVKIVATQGTLSHKSEITVAVTAQPVSRSPTLIEQPLVLAGIALVVIGALGGLTFLLLRRRRTPLAVPETPPPS